MNNLTNYPGYQQGIHFNPACTIKPYPVDYNVTEFIMKHLEYGILHKITDIVSVVHNDLSKGFIKKDTQVIFKVLNTYKVWENRGQKPLDQDSIVIR